MQRLRRRRVPVEPPVTIRVSRRVLPGKEAEFEAFVAGIGKAAETFPGFISSRSIRPGRGSDRYDVILTFDRDENLNAWKHSAERAEWYAIGDTLSVDEPRFANISGTAQSRKLAIALTPLQGFVQTSVSGIGLLLLGTILAVICANTSLSHDYERFWSAKLTIGTPSFGITESMRHWVNDALMALFFFIVGLEIKRELLVGELRYPKQAALPIAAAFGGAIFPAAIFGLLNLGGDSFDGWGIPIGTDTAFSLGVLSLMAARVRPLLLVFLTAFAIVDDILAVLVIALFYTETIDWIALGIGALLIGVLVVANRAGMHRWPIYAALGVGAWIAIFESGIHGTAAGVLVAMTVPARSWINPSEFLVRSRKLIDDFEAACFIAPSVLSNEPQQQATQSLEQLCEEVETPMTHFQHKLNPWVAFAILPIFAFANAGIPLTDGLGDALGSSIAWGVILGLLIGKPVGILLFMWLAVKAGIAIKPAAIAWSHVAGVALLGGIGFTMSLFITELSFGEGEMADMARVGVLLGSTIAGAVGYAVLRRTLPPPRLDEA